MKGIPRKLTRKEYTVIQQATNVDSENRWNRIEVLLRRETCTDRLRNTMLSKLEAFMWIFNLDLHWTLQKFIRVSNPLYYKEETEMKSVSSASIIRRIRSKHSEAI